MLQNIAPTLIKDMLEYNIASLDSIRNRVDELIKTVEIEKFMFPDHSISHCDNIVKIIDTILNTQNFFLSEIESYILIASCYLHDIGLISGELLRDDRGYLPIECYPHDVRMQHARLSEAIIMDWELQKKIGVKIQFEQQSVAPIVAKICSVHNNSSDLQYLVKQEVIGELNIRLRFLAALLILGEELHVGSGRVRIENLPKEKVSLESRIFWYRNSCIKAVETEIPNINFIFEQPQNFQNKIFEEYVIQPISDHFSREFSILNPIFVEEGLNKLIFKHKTIKSKIKATPSINLFYATSVLESDIRNRNKMRIKSINKKIKAKGLINRGIIDNELVILKRWGSYTPRMPIWNNLKGKTIPGPEESRGGGYLLIWNKIGLAIDPGYDFLRNLWQQEISSNNYFELDDIKGVICSHAHDDHTHDLEPIISLLNKRNKITSKTHKFHLYCSEGVHIKYERLLSFNKFINITDLVSQRVPTPLPSNDKFLLTKGINLEFFSTDHNELPWIQNNTGVALKLRLVNKGKEVVIGYTSDTRYSKEIVEFFKDVDALIIHFGNLGPLRGTNPYDKNHLGLNGCHDLINELKYCKPRLFLLDEFGEEEIGDDRINLCSLLEDLTDLRGVGKILIPLDIGLRIKLPQLDVFCQEHKHFVPLDKIAAHTPPNNNGIVYFCK